MAVTKWFNDTHDGGAGPSSHISLSNDDHTVTTVGGSGNESVGGNNPRTTGKWFISYSDITIIGGGGRLGFWAPGHDSYGGTGQFGIDPGGNSHDTTGSSFGDFGGTPQGHIVDFAVNLDDLLFWARYDGGDWNNSGTADPTTNTGGHSLAGLVTPIAPFSWMQFDGATVTLDGGDYPSPTFPYAPPSGYSPWNGLTDVMIAVEAPDVLHAVGYPGDFGILGTLDATEAPDVLAATGYQPISGTFNGLETPDVLHAFGRIPLTGVLAATERPDRLVAAGIGYGEDGVLDTTEAPDIFNAVGFIAPIGTFDTSEAPDRFSAIGSGVTQVRRRRHSFIT